ncbi:Qat anti-phage system associated protein QatB [Cyclobacterium plantarum]|uniref:Qat anti-phage system associated protein QatB n=1 Tax=Cyclobacterium plantarum TaxID=2716263 RepID=UPI003F70B119
MGTSQSSKGSPSGVPMVPPWVPDIDSDEASVPNDPKQPDENGSDDLEGSDPKNPDPIAPARRFGPARRSLNAFAKSGDTSSMKKGVGQFIKQGYGGGKSAVKRFGGTISTGGALFSALAGASEGKSYKEFNPYDLKSGSSQEIVDRLIEVIKPIDGTQDAEACRNAIQTAFSELLAKDETLDLLNLSHENCIFITERFVADDVFRRLELDVGKNISDNAPSANSALGRLREVKNFIRETVASSFRKIQESGKIVSNSTILSVIRTSLANSFLVFEDYIK